MRRAAYRLLSWGIIGLMVACTRVASPPLFTVTAVDPETVEPGDTLRIFGQGFPPGPARLEFIGKIATSPLNPPQLRTVATSGTAVSATEIAVPVTDAFLERFAPGGGLFTGTVTVSFAPKIKASPVQLQAHSAPFTLALQPQASAVVVRALRVRRTAAALRRMGIHIDADARVDSGVVAARVTPGSIADRAQVIPGSRLLTVDGFPATEIDDLFGLRMDIPHRFEFIDPTGATVSLLWKSTQTEDLHLFWAVFFSALALGALLAVSIPVRLPPIAYRGAATSLGWGLGTVVVLLGATAFVQWRTAPWLPLVVWILGTAAAVAAGWSAPARLRGVVRSTGYAATAGLLVAAGAATCAAWIPAHVVAAQRNFPWDIAVWRNPFWMGTTLLSLRFLWPLPSDNQSMGGTVFSFAAAAAASVLVAVYGMGGWAFPHIDLDPVDAFGDVLIGSGITAAKALCLLWLVHHLGTGADQRRAAGIGTPSRMLLIAAGAAAGAWWQWWSHLPIGDRAVPMICVGIFFSFVAWRITTAMHRRFPQGSAP